MSAIYGNFSIVFSTRAVAAVRCISMTVFKIVMSESCAFLQNVRVYANLYWICRTPELLFHMI